MPKRSRRQPRKRNDSAADATTEEVVPEAVQVEKTLAQPAKSSAKRRRPTKKQDAADVDRAASEGMGQPQDLSEPEPAKTKDPHAVALGRKGGLKGGKARAEKLTKEQRIASAKKAAIARWNKRESAS